MFAPLPLVTVAVQAVELSTATEGGAQLTLVAVARRPTPSSKLPVLAACLASPPEPPVSLRGPVPTAVGVWFPLHLTAGSRGHLAAPCAVPPGLQFSTVSLPAPPLALPPPAAVPFSPLPLVTVAVQAVALSTATEGGAQLTLVAVARRPTLRRSCRCSSHAWHRL